MELQRQRFDEIDIAKGIGILFVVFGHALKQIEVDSQVIQDMLLIIHSFHMPLFFALSGFVSVKIFRLKSKDKPDHIKDRAIRLLTPYFVMSILYLPLKMVMSSFALRPYDLHSAWRILIGESPDTTMWFLYILFWCHLIALLILTKKNLTWVLIIAFLVSLAAHLFAWPFKIPAYFVFFVFGIFVREHYEGFRALFKWHWALIAFVAFAGTQVASILTGHNLSFPVAPFTGTFLVWYIASLIAGRDGLAKKTWTLLGSMSMDIYVLSDPIMICLRLVLSGILGLSVPICIGLFFVLSVILAYLASTLVIRRVPLFSLLFLGMRGSSKK